MKKPIGRPCDEGAPKRGTIAFRELPEWLDRLDRLSRVGESPNQAARRLMRQMIEIVDQAGA